MTIQWRALKNKIANCKLCQLHKQRTKVVFGKGSLKSKIMLIGEAPGRNEDLTGKPFVGKAGKFLQECLDSLRLNKKQVFITNVIKCRPPHNRDPKQDEIKKCLIFLKQQIFLIQPKIIITLGRFALKVFIQNDISRVHGKPRKIMWRYNKEKLGLILFPMFHPAIALYRKRFKRIIKKDFIKLRKLINSKT